MSHQPWKKAIFGLSGFAILVFVNIWGILGNSALSCTIFDLTGKQTTGALIIFASLGWAAAYALFFF